MQIIFKKKSSGTTDRTEYIDEGSTITENYNETLDSADIRISHITSDKRLNIEPFDKVILRDENGNLDDRYMCIDTYTETMECVNDPYMYSYQISLFSETKELEGISLPNSSITKLADGSHRSIYFYLLQFLELYGEKIRKGTLNNHLFQPKYTFASRIENKFDTTDCPEMQWNSPTLREVLTDLMMVKDCIPVVRNNVIDYIDLTEKKDAVDTTKVNYIQRSQSSEDYVSELKMNMVNVMQTTVNGVDNSTDVVEYLLFKAGGNNNIVTDNNIVLKTSYPINKIKSIKMYRQLSAEYESGDVKQYSKAMYSCDLTNVDGYRFILEKQQYDCLDVARYASFDENTPVYELAKYQNFCVYFQRGSNLIEGWSNLTKNWTSQIFGSKTAFYHLLDILCVLKLWNLESEQDPEDYSTGGYTLTRYHAGNSYENSYYSTFFKIEYETTVETTFQASKDIAPLHKRVIIDNQTNSFVDAYNQGFMEYQKANRLGNQQLYINARYEDDFEDILKIGDYYDDSIVYQTTYQIYKHHIEVNAVATKNYILRDYFTGVKARVRSWKIASDSEALRRNVLDKVYAEFSRKQKLEDATFSTDISEQLLSPLITTEIGPLKYCAVYFTTLNHDRLPSGSSNFYVTELCSRIIGNSLLFYMSGEDNFALGKRVSSEVNSSKIENSDSSGSGFHPFRIDNDWSNNYGGIKLEPIRYVDDNGEFYSMGYKLISDIDSYFETDIWSSSDEINFMVSASQKPFVAEADIEDYYEYEKILTLKKDNKEIISLSTQFEFCSDTHDIVFTKRFLELQKWIRITNGSSIKIYQGPINDFDWRNPTLTNATLVANGGVSFLHYPTSSKITITGSLTVSRAYYITDSSDNILLATRGVTIFYLNVLLSRDYNIYDTDGNVIGSI